MCRDVGMESAVFWRRSLLALLFVVASAPAVAADAPAEPRRPDVVLVTLDTTRADRIGCYGDDSATTPTLDGLASVGVRFARALTATPLTLPAHATLMTGRVPPRHGLHDNGLAALPESMPTLAQALRTAGYQTGAFVASGVLDHRFGLDRGFETYDDALVAEHVGEYGYPERDARAVTDAALDWVAGLADDAPFFLWVHYYDPHSPYLDHSAGGGSIGTDSRYGSEITFVDGQLGRLLAALPGKAEQRVVAVVGDHGEMLGEHGERAHGLLLYRASLEVPLILAGPGTGAGRVVQNPVAIRGLGASLLRLVGLASGEPLGAPLPGLFAPAAEPAAPIYSETWLPATAYGWSVMLAVTDGRWRYVQSPRPELFDFLADPGETVNLIEREPQRAERMRGLLAGFSAEPGNEPRPQPVDDAELDAQLRALGYLSGLSAGGDDAIDAKDGIALLAEFEAAKKLFGRGEVWAARSRFDNLVRRNPSNVPFLMRAADSQFATGNVDRGMALLDRALVINPDFDLLHMRLADARLSSGDVEGSAAAYRRAVELNPRLASAWLGLAQLAAMEGDAVLERSRLQEALDAGTVSAGIFTRYAQLAAAAGETVRADQLLRRATELVPTLLPAWASWAELAAKSGDWPAALVRYRRLIALDPGNRRWPREVAAALARLPADGGGDG